VPSELEKLMAPVKKKIAIKSVIYGGYGGNRTCYHHFLPFYEKQPKTMNNQGNSAPHPFLENSPSCLSRSEIVCR
jgi:hypothetical protein